jgi:Concanavalin A-like lectin/glucanases superfamily
MTGGFKRAPRTSIARGNTLLRAAIAVLATLAFVQPAHAAVVAAMPLDDGAPTARSDDRGSATSLSGSSGVSLGATPTLAGDFSIEVWVNVAPGARGTRYVVSKGSTISGVNLQLDGSNRPQFRGGTTTATAPAIAAGTWHQLVATVATRSAKLYVDGRLAGSATLPAAPVANAFGLWLGRNAASATGYFVGRVDELSFYDAALTDADVAARYAAVADTTPPAVALTMRPAATVNTGAATVAFASSKSQSTFTCSLDGGAWTACDGSVAYSGLAEGNHQVAVQATDRYGIAAAAPATTSWTVDVTPPETLMLATTPAGAAPQASFSSESGASFECRQGSGAWSACTSPVTAAAGSVLAVRARDRAGNVDPSPATATFPAASASPYVSTAASFVVAGARSTAGLECQIDGGAWGACPAPLTLTGLGFGDHQLVVRDQHLAQLAGAASLSWNVAVPLPRLISARFPSLLTFASRRAQRQTKASRAPRLLFLSNVDAKVTATLTRRRRRVAAWTVAIHRGSNTMPFPIGQLRKLRAGRHVLALQPTNGAGAGRALSMRFDVVALRR